jgi:hypothetical protein
VLSIVLPSLVVDSVISSSFILSFVSNLLRTQKRRSSSTSTAQRKEKIKKYRLLENAIPFTSYISYIADRQYHILY